MPYPYFFIEHPEGLAAGVFLIIFTIAYTLILQLFKDRGTSLVIALVISTIAAWGLYRERFYGWEFSLGTIFILIVFVFGFWLIIRMFRGVRSGFG